MDINSIVNSVIGGLSSQVIGLAVGVAGGMVLFSLYKAYNVAGYIKDGAKGLGAYAGQRAAVYVKRIRDEGLRKQVSSDIKNAPNEFDEAFDKAFDEELGR